MELHVFTPEFVRIGIIQSYISLSWMENYQSPGAFTLIINDFDENLKILKSGNYIFRHGKKTAMIIKFLKFDSARKTVEISGYGTLELLNQRIIAGIKNVTNAERGMYEIVSENLRGKTRIINAPLKGLPEEFLGQRSYTPVVDSLTKIATETQLGIIMNFDFRNKTHVFEVYKGLDRRFGQRDNPPVIFSAEYGNLNSTIVVSDDTLFKNVAYVMGAGEGNARTVVVVGDAQGDDRYELAVDARDIQPEDAPDGETQSQKAQRMARYREELRTRGVDKLNEHIKRQSFSAEADSRDFGEKYDLGDLVTCQSNQYGIRLNVRISRFREVVENNITKVTLTLGDPEITVIDEVKIWQS